MGAAFCLGAFRAAYQFVGTLMTLTLLVAATLLSGLIIGLIPAVVDGVKKPLQGQPNLPDGRPKWFIALFYLAWLPAMPLAGWMLDTLPTREILFGGLVALILGVAWLALVRSASSLLLNGLFLGLAYSCVTTAAISLMPKVFFAESSNGHRLNIASLNVGFVAVGLGAMAGPWLVAALERCGGYRQGLLYLSVALIVPAALTAISDRDLFPTAPNQLASWNEVFSYPQMWLIVFVILLYFALENCLEFWPESYLKELGHQGAGLQVSLLIFWLAFIATRAAAAWALFEYARFPQFAFALTIVLAILSAFILGNLTGGFDLGSGTLWFWLLGACYGPILPGLLGMALEVYPTPIPVSILGVLLALSGLDTLVMRPVMIGFGTGRAARRIMWIPTVLALVLAAPMLLLAFLRY